MGWSGITRSGGRPAMFCCKGWPKWRRQNTEFENCINDYVTTNNPKLLTKVSKNQFSSVVPNLFMDLPYQQSRNRGICRQMTLYWRFSETSASVMRPPTQRKPSFMMGPRECNMLPLEIPSLTLTHQPHREKSAAESTEPQTTLHLQDLLTHEWESLIPYKWTEPSWLERRKSLTAHYRNATNLNRWHQSEKNDKILGMMSHVFLRRTRSTYGFFDLRIVVINTNPVALATLLLKSANTQTHSSTAYIEEWPLRPNLWKQGLLC